MLTVGSDFSREACGFGKAFLMLIVRSPHWSSGSQEGFRAHVLGMALTFTMASFSGGVESSQGSMGITPMSLDQCCMINATEASVRSPSMVGTVRDMTGVGVR